MSCQFFYIQTQVVCFLVCCSLRRISYDSRCLVVVIVGMVIISSWEKTQYATQRIVSVTAFLTSPTATPKHQNPTTLSSTHISSQKLQTFGHKTSKSLALLFLLSIHHFSFLVFLFFRWGLG